MVRILITFAARMNERTIKDCYLGFANEKLKPWLYTLPVPSRSGARIEPGLLTTESTHVIKYSASLQPPEKGRYIFWQFALQFCFLFP